MGKLDEREYGWFDENGCYYYMNRFMGFRFYGNDIPEEYAEKPDATDAAKKILTGLLEEPVKFEMEQVEALTLKQIAERTVKMDGLRYVQLGQSMFNPKYLKMMRRAFRDAQWYVRPDKGTLSNLYLVDPWSSQVIGVLLPMRVQRLHG